MVRILLFSAAFAAAILAPAAQAQRWDDGDWLQTTVQAADLDLSTNAGVTELDRRIDRAVDRICGSDRDCRDGAWASTYAQVDAAVARDRWMRQLAAEREAELRACGWQGCRQQAPAYYPPPPPPQVYPGATVIIIQTGYPPPPQVYWRR
jgi:UrcA family protein